MVDWLKKLVNYFFKKEPEKKEEKREPPEVWSGSWKLSTLVSELPRYNKILAKLDRYRKMEIGSTLRMGPTLIAGNDAWLSTTDDYSMWRVLPTQFFVSWGDPYEQKGDHVQPTFFAGIKVKPPLTVERLPGECYKFCLYWR